MGRVWRRKPLSRHSLSGLAALQTPLLACGGGSLPQETLHPCCCAGSRVGSLWGTGLLLLDESGMGMGTQSGEGHSGPAQKQAAVLTDHPVQVGREAPRGAAALPPPPQAWSFLPAETFPQSAPPRQAGSCPLAPPLQCSWALPSTRGSSAKNLYGGILQRQTITNRMKVWNKARKEDPPTPEMQRKQNTGL